jgi:hypothetical protein
MSDSAAWLVLPLLLLHCVFFRLLPMQAKSAMGVAPADCELFDSA